MSVLSITGSGSFPFCLVPASSGQVGPGTAYPVGLSLADAMRWYWQAQSWQVTAAFSFSGTQPSESDPTFSAPIGDTLTVARSGAQNTLVCPSGLMGNDGTIVFALWSDGGGEPYAYTYGGLIYPLLTLTCVNAILTVASTPGFLTFPKPWPEPAVADGNSFPLWYDEEAGYDSVDGVPGDNGPWTQSKSGTATISIVSTY